MERRVAASWNAYFEDLQLGDKFVSGGRTVTEADLVAFAGLSGDHNQLHTDEVYAQSGPFGHRVAHGCLTLSLATGLEYAILNRDSRDCVVGLYGMDRVRFTKPVFIGDTIHLESEITELHEKDANRGVVTLHQVVKNQRGDTVVVLEKRLLNRRRPPPDS